MKTPESSSGLRIARFWKTKASISMPVPAIVQAISEPRMPVATPKRAGSENTPAPTMPPTTIAVSVGRLILATVALDSVDAPSTESVIIASTFRAESAPRAGPSSDRCRVDVLTRSG